MQKSCMYKDIHQDTDYTHTTPNGKKRVHRLNIQRVIMFNKVYKLSFCTHFTNKINSSFRKTMIISSHLLIFKALNLYYEACVVRKNVVSMYKTLERGLLHIYPHPLQVLEFKDFLQQKPTIYYTFSLHYGQENPFLRSYLVFEILF